jgi:hypothetical protein
MCPACIATAALVVAGATSTGGLIALVVKKLPDDTGAKRIDPTTRTGGEFDGSCESRINYLDLTPLGRQEDQEPRGQRGVAAGKRSWIRRHDQYASSRLT